MDVEKKQARNQSSDVCVEVNPGVCGFSCVIHARKRDTQTVSLEIINSECKQIQKLSEKLMGKRGIKQLKLAAVIF